MSEPIAGTQSVQSDEHVSRAIPDRSHGISGETALKTARKDLADLIRDFELRAWELSRRPDLYAEADAQGLIDELLEDASILEGVLAVLLRLDPPVQVSSQQGSPPI